MYVLLGCFSHMSLEEWLCLSVRVCICEVEPWVSSFDISELLN
jgi:hypothetical protein